MALISKSQLYSAPCAYFVSVCMLSLSLSLSLSSLSHCYKLILRLSFLSIPVFEKSDKSIGNAFCFFLFFYFSLSLSRIFFLSFSREPHTLNFLSIFLLSHSHAHAVFNYWKVKRKTLHCQFLFYALKVLFL